MDSYDIIGKINDILKELITTYYKDSSSETLKRIYTIAHSFIVITSNGCMIKSHLGGNERLSDDDIDDLTLTYVLRVVDRTYVSREPIFVITRIVKQYIEKGWKIYYHKYEAPDITNEALFMLEDALNEIRKSVPSRLFAAILYSYMYGPLDVGEYSLLDQLAILVKVKKLNSVLCINNLIINNSRSINNMTTNMLLLSGLYKLNPLMFTIAVLTKGDLSSCLQISKLFEGQTVTIPNVSLIMETIRQSASLAATTESKELTVNEREALAILATNNYDFSTVSSDDELTPVMDEFIRESVVLFLDRYNKVQDKMLNSLTNYSSPERFVAIYKQINEELNIQMTIIKEILNSIESADKIKEIKTVKSN